MEIEREHLRDLCLALESFVVSMDYSSEQFEGHNESYRKIVCLPRAKEILEKLEYEKKLKQELIK